MPHSFSDLVTCSSPQLCLEASMKQYKGVETFNTVFAEEEFEFLFMSLVYGFR